MSNTIGSYFPQPVRDSLQPGTGRNESSPGFGDALTTAFEQVNKLQSDADVQVANLAQSNDQDIHSAMIAVEKADISFQLMMQVRNKIVSAYQEISRMQF
jgi:flagellar hook-basal body complex protein FliE